MQLNFLSPSTMGHGTNQVTDDINVILDVLRSFLQTTVASTRILFSPSIYLQRNADVY